MVPFTSKTENPDLTISTKLHLAINLMWIVAIVALLYASLDQWVDPERSLDLIHHLTTAVLVVICLYVGWLLVIAVRLMVYRRYWKAVAMILLMVFQALWIRWISFIWASTLMA